MCKFYSNLFSFFAPNEFRPGFFFFGWCKTAVFKQSKKIIIFSLSFGSNLVFFFYEKKEKENSILVIFFFLLSWVSFDFWTFFGFDSWNRRVNRSFGNLIFFHFLLLFFVDTLNMPKRIYNLLCTTNWTNISSWATKLESKSQKKTEATDRIRKNPKSYVHSFKKIQFNSIHS